MQKLIEQKQKALEKYLIRNDEFSKEELRDLVYQDGWDEFEIASQSYKVLTDEEANEQVWDYIRESLWAFKPGFLVRYMPGGVNKKVIAILQQECEGCNDALFGMINAEEGRFDALVNNAIALDGRGRYLSSYDGREYKEDINGEWFYIYRTN